MDDFHLEGVILDMDGTLLDSEPLHEMAVGDAIASMGFSPDLFDHEDLRGLGVVLSGTVLQRVYGSAFSPEGFVSAFRKHLLEVLIREPIPLKPGVKELFKRIDEAGLPMAVASSSDRTAVEYSLEKTGLRPFLQAVVGGDDASRAKPEPDLFLLAASKLEISPGNCMVIEDAEAGIVAATRAGMRAILIPDGLSSSRIANSGADHVLSDLFEALDVLEPMLPDAPRLQTIGRMADDPTE